MGSGVWVGGVFGTPPMSSPQVVPKENIALLTVVFEVINALLMTFEVINALLMTKVAVWLINGLCGPFPAIEAFALV